MASGRTALRGLPYPLETDTPDVAADMASLANALDTRPLVGQGALAGRPPSAVAGNRYYVSGDSDNTQNGIEWLDTGNGYVAVTYPDVERQKNKGAANGYAGLDASSHVPLANLSGLKSAQLASNAALTDGQLASPNNAAKRLLLQESVMLGSTTIGTTDAPGTFMWLFAGDNIFLNGEIMNSQPMPKLFIPDPNGGTNFSVAGKTFYGHLRLAAAANGGAVNVSMRLYAVQLTGAAGGSGQLLLNSSTISNASTGAITLGANGVWTASSGQWTMPFGNPIALGLTLWDNTGTIGSTAAIGITGSLWGYWA